MAEAITFVASGIRRSAASRSAVITRESQFGTIKDSVALTSQRGGTDGDVRMEAVPGEDIVVVHVAGGPALWLHPEHARDLLMAQQDPARARGAGDVRPNEV